MANTVRVISAFRRMLAAAAADVDAAAIRWALWNRVALKIISEFKIIIKPYGTIYPKYRLTLYKNL